jgi:hypothetical protein
MKKLPGCFWGGLLLCIAIVGCAKREYSTARVILSGDAQAQTQLMTYAASAAFASDVRARMGTNVAGGFGVAVQQLPNSSVVLLRGASNDPLAAAQAANTMAAVLRGYAKERNLGSVALLERAVPRKGDRNTAGNGGPGGLSQ